MPPNNTDRMGNSEESDQAAPLVAGDLGFLLACAYLYWGMVMNKNWIGLKNADR